MLGRAYADLSPGLCLQKNMKAKSFEETNKAPKLSTSIHLPQANHYIYFQVHMISRRSHGELCISPFPCECVRKHSNPSQYIIRLYEAYNIERHDKKPPTCMNLKMSFLAAPLPCLFFLFASDCGMPSPSKEFIHSLLSDQHLPCSLDASTAFDPRNLEKLFLKYFSLSYDIELILEHLLFGSLHNSFTVPLLSCLLLVIFCADYYIIIGIRARWPRAADGWLPVMIEALKPFG
ncbi:hypothetical protein M5K25_025510 [Dendrobium thyrsiflorum]|uniref:Uncharacterized protein n=1 Tax=Dendrobium thyrsiflorum TaxID=117978 RepID=A0ABD0U477_DENTH